VQNAHDAEPSRFEALPASQSAHVDAAGAEYDPSVHRRQDSAPKLVATFPEAHGVQEVNPVAPATNPGLQLVHADEPANSAYLPTGQFKQSAPGWFKNFPCAQTVHPTEFACE
jgi:hypothetical protein